MLCVCVSNLRSVSRGRERMDEGLVRRRKRAVLQVLPHRIEAAPHGRHRGRVRGGREEGMKVAAISICDMMGL